MLRKLLALAVLVGVVALVGEDVTTQQQFPPGYIDPAPILAAARKAIGTDNLRCVTIAGTGYNGAVGQVRESARNTDWPRPDALNNFGAQATTAGHNAFGRQMKDVKANACADPVAVPESVRTATFPTAVTTQKLADGIYLMGGGSHNSVAIEFANNITVFEAPLSEARSLAVIEEIVKLIPNKQIRFVVNTHQHFDHLGGLRAYMHIGATILTHWKNYDFYTRDVLNYEPRTMKPDMVTLWPPTELAEGYYYEAIRENCVVSDGKRTLQLHYVNPQQHAEGMLMGYLPNERILIEADLLNTNEPLPTTLSRDQRSFFNAVRKLKLDVNQLVPIHGNPIPWSNFSKVASTTN